MIDINFNNFENPNKLKNYPYTVFLFVLIIEMKIFKVIKEVVETRWPMIKFFENVLVVFPVPAEFSGKSKEIMRKCAKLIENKD